MDIIIWHDTPPVWYPEFGIPGGSLSGSNSRIQDTGEIDPKTYAVVRSFSALLPVEPHVIN
jgi:hypothetical protein